MRSCCFRTSYYSGFQTPTYATRMYVSQDSQVIVRYIRLVDGCVGRASAERQQGLRGPVTRGVLLVGNVDPYAVGDVRRPAAMSALGVGEAAHWATACHLCPPPRRRRGPQRLQLRSSSQCGLNSTRHRSGRSKQRTASSFSFSQSQQMAEQSEHPILRSFDAPLP